MLRFTCTRNPAARGHIAREECVHSRDEFLHLERLYQKPATPSASQFSWSALKSFAVHMMTPMAAVSVTRATCAALPRRAVSAS
jgi:hypothetical protein